MEDVIEEEDGQNGAEGEMTQSRVSQRPCGDLEAAEGRQKACKRGGGGLSTAIYGVHIPSLLQAADI